jgi:hypothetical protein
MSNELLSGRELHINDELKSTDLRFSLKMQNDGNLVLYRNSDAYPLWASGTNGSGAVKVIMQSDGNLVLYTRPIRPLGGVVINYQPVSVWASNTAGSPDSLLQLQNDGNLVIYKGETVIWATNTVVTKDRLNPGEELHINDELRSTDLRFSLKMQNDGNLVLYRNSDAYPLWASGTNGSDAVKAIMQSDGNLVLYTRPVPPPQGDIVINYQPVSIWASNTAGSPNSFLQLQNDGNLVIYSASVSVWDVWALQKQIAAQKINVFYIQTNGEAGPLGISTGEITRKFDGTHIQDFAFGTVQDNENGDVTGWTTYEAAVTMAGVKCIATDDPGGVDELYAIVSLISFNEHGDSEAKVVTKQYNIVDTRTGNVQYVNNDVGRIGVSGSGIRIHILLMDHESGDHEAVKDRVNGLLVESARDVAYAIWGVVGSAAVDAIIDNKFGRWAVGGLMDLIANIFEDDIIGEMTYTITAGDIKYLCEKANEGFPNFTTSLKHSVDLPQDVTYNFPFQGDTNPDWLIDIGSGTYKAYFRVEPRIIVGPINPRN